MSLEKAQATPARQLVAALHAMAGASAADTKAASVLMHVGTVAACVGLSIPTIYRRMKTGEFPQPVRMGRRCTRWRSDEIRAWIDRQASDPPIAAPSRGASESTPSQTNPLTKLSSGSGWLAVEPGRSGRAIARAVEA